MQQLGSPQGLLLESASPWYVCADFKSLAWLGELGLVNINSKKVAVVTHSQTTHATKALHVEYDSELLAGSAVSHYNSPVGWVENTTTINSSSH